MNDAPLTRIHRAEEKRQAGRADSVGGVARHGSEFSLAHRAEAVNVADKALTFREAAREGLIDEVFDRVEQFAALASQKQRVLAAYVQRADALALVRLGVEAEAGGAKDVVQKLTSLFV